MKNILVPVDGSGAALRALRQAVVLARLSPGAKIHLVHAHEEPTTFGEISVYVPREKMAALQREHSLGILAPAEAELESAGVPYTAEILTGPIGRAIAEHAEKAGCDLIVMGRHGKSALGDMLAGSVAQKVLHASKLPVLLVR
jgi:nucleotide-binding universal stress UspA family protein